MQYDFGVLGVIVTTLVGVYSSSEFLTILSEVTFYLGEKVLERQVDKTVEMKSFFENVLEEAKKSGPLQYSVTKKDKGSIIKNLITAPTINFPSIEKSFTPDSVMNTIYLSIKFPGANVLNFPRKVLSE